MRAVRSVGLGTIAALAAVMIAGCGVRLQLVGPSQVRAGASVPYTLNLTNPGRCPVGNVNVRVFPLIPASELDVVGDDPDLIDFLFALLNSLCTGAPFELPDGVECRIEGDEIICEREDAQSAPGGGEATVSTPSGPLFHCSRDGGTVTCTTTQAQQATAALNGVLTCTPDGFDLDCSTDSIAPGQTESAMFTLTAPSSPGLYRTFAFGGASDLGVCKAGSNVGGPCGTDAECPGGTMDDCGDGICVNDMTQATGAGCDTTPDCAMGETCVPCANPDEILLPLACQQISVTVSAPLMSSPMGMAAMVLVLFGLRVYQLRRREQI